MPIVTSSGGGGASTPGGVGGAVQTVPVVDSNVDPTSYGTSGIGYTPLAKNATEQYITFEAVAPATGTLKLSLIYAMSASNGGDVVLAVDTLKVADTGDPNGALTAGSNRTFTPGTGTTRKTATVTQVAELNISVTAGDHVYAKVTRKNVAGDTHTGSMNVFGVRVEFT